MIALIVIIISKNRLFQRLSEEMARFSWRHQLKHFQQEFRVVAFDNRCVDSIDGWCGDEKELAGAVRAKIPRSKDR